MSEIRPLKIGFDAKRLFLNDTGLGNYSRTLVKNMKRFYPQHEYHLFTPSIRETSETQIFLKGDYHIHTPGSFEIKALWRSRGMSKTINALKLDVFHGLSHELPIGISNATRTVVSMHDLIYEVYPHFFPWYNRWLYRWKYKTSCKKADHVIAISEATRHDLISRYHLDGKKVSVVYQSCGDYFVPRSRNKQKKHFLYVGTIEERKGLLHAVHAYAQLPKELQIPFLVVGNGRAYAEEVKKAVQYYGIEKQFQFLGKLKNEEIADLYHDALALILPSVYEGFGIPIAESLFTGTPVITSPFSALPEAAGPGGITVDPSHHEALAESMKQMFVPEKWQKLSDEGSMYVHTHFTAQATAAQLNGLYQKLKDY
ncbi:MAG TPA: glycosyltransferase family 1 protein [Saprospiraceae bacterium]|nr:glycosyltransferase family 1 protein [Saprospiraceae bacterium]